MAVAIDGRIYNHADYQPVGPDTEIHLIPRIAGRRLSQADPWLRRPVIGATGALCARSINRFESMAPTPHAGQPAAEA